MAGSPFFTRIETLDLVLQKAVQNYRRKGLHFIEGLDGVFGGVLFDKEKQEVFIFNDRFGLQPLFWATCSDFDVFSTSAISLARILSTPLDIEGISQFIGLRTLLGSRTFFKDVWRFPPATILTLQGEKKEWSVYWDPKQAVDTRLLTQSALDDASDLFGRAVSRRVPQDRRVGLGLTGGMDTRAILSALNNENVNCTAFTITGLKKNLENDIVSRISENRRISHRFFYVEKDIQGNFVEALKKYTRELDGEVPGLSFCHWIPACSQQSLYSSVLFDGIGGEIFRGEHYRIGYKKRSIERNILDHLAWKLIYKGGYLNSLNPDLLSNPCEFLRESLSKELLFCDCGDTWATLDLFHMRNELRRLGGGAVWAMNRNIMACLPFLDKEFVEFCLKFCGYDNNRSLFHSHIIYRNSSELANIPRRIDFGGFLKIKTKRRWLDKIYLYWNSLSRLPSYVALHFFSIFPDPFGYKDILMKNSEFIEEHFLNKSLETDFLYEKNRLISIFKGEKRNGYLHYYTLSHLLTIELLSRELNVP